MGATLGKFTDWTGITNIEGEKKAGKESRRIGEEQAQKQEAAVDYLRGLDELPQQLRQGAMQQYGGLYGIGDDSAGALDQLKMSPIYQGIMGTQLQGEESILRNQAATGGLRTGNTQQALAQYSGNLENQALMQTMGGLQGLMQTPTYAENIYQGMGGVAQTQAQAQLAEQAGVLAGANQLRNFAQNERQYGHEVGMSFLGGGSSGGGGGGGGMFSDEALKDNISKTGVENGYNTYKWTWNDIAKSLGLTGDAYGVLAHEVEKDTPNAVSMKNGFKFVNYDMVGVQHG